MKVSIITATFNSEAFIEQTIQSVINQSYKNIEYIVIDGGSNDTTLSIIDSYKQNITHLVSEKDEGIYDALNKGISLASGDLICILHSDDFYTTPLVIENAVKLIERDNSDALYANLNYVDRTNPTKITRKWISGAYKQNSFLFGWMPPHPTFMVKREVYKKFGSFNLAFKTSADYELMLRFIHKQKIKLSYLNEVIIHMRVGGQSNVSINNRVTANMEDRKAWLVNDLTPYFFTLWLKPLRKIKQFI